MPNKLPQGWVECQLGEVFETSSGGTPKRGNPEYYQNGTIPWLKSGELNNSIINSAEEFITEEGLNNSSAKIFPKGSLLIALYGATVGKLGILDFDSATNQAVCCIYQNTYYNRDFLFYYLLLKKEYLVNQGKGGAQPNISQEIVKSLLIPFPPLNEQRRIVEKIESEFAKIDDGLEHLEQAKEQIKQYRQSVLKSAFEGKLYKTSEWEIFNILELCSIINGTTIDKSLEKQFGEIPYIKVSDMNLPENSVKITTSSRFVNKNEIKANTIIPESSIIFPKRGGAIATNKKRKVISPIIIDLNIMALIPNNTNILSHEYLYYWLQNLDLSTISNGGAVPQINRYSFENLFLKLPSLEEQKHIVEEIEKRFAVADAVEKVIEDNIEKAKQLKQSILKKAFEGRLVPQDPTDEPASTLLEKIKQERSNK